MGMYDYIKCEVALPSSPPPEVADLAKKGEAQSKSFDCEMTTYTITRDGELFREEYELAVVPEEERYYFGKPEWEKGGFYHLAGVINRTVTGQTKLNYHGDVSFCVMTENHDLYDYTARFTDGKLQRIISHQDHSHPTHKAAWRNPAAFLFPVLI